MGAREMAQQSKALAILPGEFWASIWSLNCNSESRMSKAVFWPPRALHTHGAQAYMKKTLTHKVKTKINNDKSSLQTVGTEQFKK